MQNGIIESEIFWDTSLLDEAPTEELFDDAYSQENISNFTSGEEYKHTQICGNGKGCISPTPLPPIDDQPGTEVSNDQGTESSDTPPNAPDNKSAQDIDTIITHPDLNLQETDYGDAIYIEDQSIPPLPSINASEVINADPSENILSSVTHIESIVQGTIAQEQVAVIGSPDEILAETLLLGAEALNEVPRNLNGKVYDKFQAFIGTPFTDYNAKTFEEGISLVREFTICSEVVAGSAIALSTLHRIAEGELFNKLKAIYKKINTAGWEKKADELFPFAKSTRCVYMAIARISGVKKYAFLGVEKLREVEKVLKITKIKGDDSIKTLLENYAKNSDINVPYTEFRKTLDAALNDALNSNSNKKLKNNGSSQGSNVDITKNENEGETKGELSQEDGVDSLPKNLSSENVVTHPNPSRSGSADQSAKDKATKKFLNQDSLNVQLSKLNSSIDDVIEAIAVLEVEKIKFDLYLIAEAKNKIDEIEKYLTIEY